MTPNLKTNKQALHQLILAELKSRYDLASAAALQAYETATHEENVAENKYDTLGLEASYLAEGQSRRVAEAEREIKSFERLSIREFNEDDSVQFAACVGLRELSSQALMEVFLSPVAGGVRIEFEGRQILLVTDQAPLGKALLGAYLEDEISLGDKTFLLETLS
jgi:transcription elongation GreA/GreB family factor